MSMLYPDVSMPTTEEELKAGNFFGNVVERTSRGIRVACHEREVFITPKNTYNRNLNVYKVGQVVKVKIEDGTYKLMTESDPSLKLLLQNEVTREIDLLKEINGTVEGLRISSRVKATIKLVKEYGLIANVESEGQNYVGFLINEHVISKNVKVGTELEV